MRVTLEHLTPSGRHLYTVSGALERATGEGWDYLPESGTIFTTADHGPEVCITRTDDDEPGPRGWVVGVVDPGTGWPIHTAAPIQLPPAADLDPAAAAAALIPHITAARAAAAQAWYETPADENYVDDSATGRVWKRAYPSGRTGVVIPYGSGRFGWELWSLTTFEAVGTCDTDAQAREACDTCDHNTAAQ